MTLDANKLLKLRSQRKEGQGYQVTIPQAQTAAQAAHKAVDRRTVDQGKKAVLGRTANQRTEAAKARNRVMAGIHDNLAWKDYEALKNFDLKAGQKEIDELERQRGALLKPTSTHPATTYNRGGPSTSMTSGISYPAALQAPSKELTGAYALDKLISQKKQYLNQAKRIQEGIALSGVTENADFDRYSGYVSTYTDNFWDKLFENNYDAVYEYINDQNGFRDEYKDSHRAYSRDNPWSDGESVFEEKGYDYLTDNEIAIYNYHYAKDGKETAEKYLDSIQETLNHRKATEMFTNMEDKTALELAFHGLAGLDQFESGVKNNFSKADYIPQTAIQMAAGMAREDLADSSIPMWYNFKEKKWEDKVFGASAGQMAADVISTTANMAPSVLSSMAVGMVNPAAGTLLGNSMMFASSAGGAYQEALNLGYDKGQARYYSMLVGASEAGLQYLLGGIDELGGKVPGNALKKMLDGVDNAYARFALNLGGSMASEGLEEGLQEVLTPMFKSMALHADEDIDWGQVAYSALLGALTAGALEGPSSIGADARAVRDAYTPEMEAALLEAALAEDEDSDVRALAERYREQGEPLTGSQIMKLTKAYSAYEEARIQENAPEVDEEQVSAYTEEVQKRLTEQDVYDNAVVKAVVKKLTGQELNRRERRALERSAEGKKVLQDMQEGYTKRKPVIDAVREHTQKKAEAVPAEEGVEAGATEVAEDPLLEAIEAQEIAEAAMAAEEGAENAHSNPVGEADGFTEETVAESATVEPSGISEQLTAKGTNPAEVDAEDAGTSETGDVATDRVRGIAREFGLREEFVQEMLSGWTNAEVPLRGIRTVWEMGNRGIPLEQASPFERDRILLLDPDNRRRVYRAGWEAAHGAARDAASPGTERAAGGSGRTIEEVAGEYGNQAKAVSELYREGQDVEKFASAVQAAWEMGNSGIPMERAISSVRTQDIAEEHRRKAYRLGQGAARVAAQSQDKGNAKKATGGTVRRKGVVKAQSGITISELSQTFNDRQRSAYKLLSFYAEVTGIDVVLYKGTQEQETGRFAHGEDTIYIDIAAGTNGWDTTDLSAYTMMRTFSHEFVHFVEKWSAEQYNQLREVVFSQMEKNGQDAEALVELAMQEQGLDFDQASREVVAEALTDILPDSQFVQTLASKHKSLFEKIRERLEQFVVDLKEHFKKLTGNNSREAVALKSQVGEALGYAEEILQVFDKVAGEAVEAYQATVMGEEVPAAEVVAEENGEEPEAAEEAPKPDWDELGKTIPDGLRKYHNKFGGKHPMSVLTVKGKDGDTVYAGSGFLIFRINERLTNWPGFDGYMKRLMTPEQFDSFAGKGKPLTEQPMIGMNGKIKVAEFDTPDGTIFCNYDLLRYLDGNTLTYKKLGSGSAIQAVDPATGELVGVLMGMKVDGKNITDKKPGRMKSFKAAQTVKAEKPAEVPKQEAQTIADDRFTIEATKGGTVYVTFPGKPDAAVRDALKAQGFKWSPKKKAWYAKDDPARVAKTIRDAFDAYDIGVAEARERGSIIPAAKSKALEGLMKERKDDLRPVIDAFNKGVADEINRQTISEVKAAEVTPKAEEPVEAAPAVEVAPEAEMEGATPSEKIANAIVRDYLSKDQVIDSQKLYALADRAFGGTQAQGAYDRKDAYDALELAVNKYLLDFAKDMNGDGLKAMQSVRKLEELLRFLPTQTVRTQEQQDFQQFSTPPNIAYLAAWAGNVQPGEMVLEPSAGIGGIAVFAKSWGAEVAVNELSKRRLGILERMGFDHMFNENAEQIDNVLPENIQPSLVLMNPPFSSTAGRTAHNKTSNAERHIDQALARLSDGGRLVAVLGKGMNDADYRKYWNKVRKEYTIRANLSIDGSNYRKYGTTWGVQLVVIDKVGPQTGQTVTGSFTDLTEVPGILEEIRNDRKTVERPGTGRSSNVDSLPVPDGRVDGVSRERGTGSSERTPGEPTRNAGQRSGGSDAGSSRVRRGTGHGDLRQTAQAVLGIEDGQRVRGNAGADHRADDASAGAGELARPQSQRTSRLTEEAAREDDGVYATFVIPEVPIPGGRKHPATLVESAAMSAVPMPKATYTPTLPANVVASNLSDAQMVTVTYAGQAHSQMLPDGTRKGFFIGDGTGVGKGRQIAGVILDNFMQGRTKAVWVSKNGDLYGDAIRDWTGTTGRNKDEVLNHSKTKLNDPIKGDSGILFTTYPMLRSGKNSVTRLDQIVSWLGEDFDGVIAFDEAHNMGNLYGKKGSRGKTAGSEQAKAGVELQRRLPKARIVYVSATAATEVENLAYAERLGLWGQGTAFSNAQDFISKIGSSGLAAMELVVRDMKAMGAYTARSISYQGVAYDTIEHTLDENQTIIYNTMSSAWQTVMQNVHKALEITGSGKNSRARANAMGQFYSSMQRFYNQALTSMSMPSVIADIRKELAAGHSCVLQIVNTNEAQQEKALAQAKAENLELDDLDLTPREALIGYLETCFPVQEFEEYTDEDGKTQSRPVVNSKGEPVISRTAVAMREALIEQINGMSIPDGPMEMLFDAFGVEMVAENTGRSRRVVPRRQSDGTVKRVEERRTLNSRTADVQAFQDGKKRILVFSDAGGTGKSYHADRSEKNQQQRIHYVLQPGWSASNAVQGFGRTHRSNEASAPIYKLVTTNIKGQKRFTSTIARRLDQLGALTKGQRDTGSGMFGAKDNLETDLARDALREFYKRLGNNQFEGVDGARVIDRLGLKDKFYDEYGSFKMNEVTSREISTFLNRILALEVDEQNAVFDQFTGIYEMMLEDAIQKGTLDTGMENVKADKIEILDDKIIREDGNGGAATHYIQAKTYKKPKVTTTVADAENRRTGFVGIYETDNGAVRAVYRMPDKTTEWGEVRKQYRLEGPNQGAKTTVWLEDTLAKRAKLLDKKDWQAAWDKEVQRVPEYNEDTLHMLTGALLPIWNNLPQEGTTKVKRLIATDGSTYLGREIPAHMIDLTLRQFQASRTMEQFTPRQVMDKALTGTTFRLSRERGEIFRSRVSGEWRIEIKQMNDWQLKRYPGLMTERINFQTRYFIPNSPQGEKLLEEILKNNPIRDVGKEDQLQVRRVALTDRQVLELAKGRIDESKLTPAERDGFRIFSERLDRLRTLQEDRAELGQLYKEQQFGPGGDRKAAAETLEKMHRLDASIEAAANKVLEAEQGAALRKVLQEARKVVQKDQADHDEAVLKEYRQKTRETAAQRKYRRAVQFQVKEMQDFILHPDTKRMKLCPEFLHRPILEFLATIDQSSKRSLDGGEETQADKRYKDRLDTLAKVLKKAQGGDLFESYLDLPSDLIERMDEMVEEAKKVAGKAGGDLTLNRMNAQQLRELSKVLESLKTIIKTANTFHGNAMFRHVSQAGEALAKFTKKFADWSKSRGKLSALGNMENWIFWKNVRPFAALSRFGSAGESIRDELVEGQDKLARNTQAVVDFVKGTKRKKGAYTEEEVKSWEKETKRIRLAGEDKAVRLTVAQIMGLYCMAKREQAIDHLTHGGFVIQGEDGGIRKVHMTVDDLGVFHDALTRRQRAVADSLQEYMSKQGGEWGNYVTMRRFGIKAYGEEFYYPLATYDEKRSASIDKPEGSDLHALLNMSFTKKLTKGAKNAVMAYSIFDVFADHMGAMAQYNAMALPVLDAVKWLNWSQSTVNEKGFEDTVGVKTELRRVFGIPPAKRGKGGNVSVSKGYAESFLLGILKSYNSTSPQATPNDKLGLGLLHRYNRSQVAWNASVVIKQPLAVFRAMQVVNPVHLAAGANPAAVRKGIEEMLKHSGIAIWKHLGFYDVNVSKGMGKLIRQDDNLLDKITDWGMQGAEWADLLTWAMIWNGCKAQCGGNMKKTAELFNKVIYESQVVDSVLTKTEYMRDQGFVSRLLSSFMSESAAAISPILNDVYLMEMEMQRKGGSFQTAWHKHGGHFMRSVAVYSVTGIITTMVAALVSAWRDDDDYQTFGEKWQEAMDGAILEELNPLTKLPLIGDVAEGMDAVYKAVVKGEDPMLFLSALPMGEIIQYAVDGGKILHDLISGDTNYTWYGAVRKLLQAASGASGIPAATFSREIVDVWNNIIVPMAPSLGIEHKVKTYRKDAAAEIRDAFTGGYLTEEEATDKITELVEGANGDKAKLKELGFSSIEDENDIYWKLRGWENGSDWNKYDALEQAMAKGGDISGEMDELTTHGVKEKTVRTKIKDIIGDWLREGVISEAEAEKLLVKYGEDRSGDAADRVQEWKCEIETGIPFSGIKEAYLDDEITEAEAKRMYMKYGGYSERRAEDTITEWKAEYDTGTAFSDTRDAYVSGEMTADTARSVLQTYGGYSKSEAESKVLQWQCEIDTGVRYDDVQQLYVDGEMTADKARELRVKYGESSIEDARKTVLQWQCEKDNGIKYSDIDVAYLSGDITEETAIKWLVKYGEKDEETAALATQAYRWRDQHTEYKDLSDSAIDRYIDFCEDANISIPAFYEARKQVSEISEAGGTVKDNVVRYIRSLPLSRQQKWAMWYAVKTKSWKDNVSF